MFLKAGANLEYIILLAPNDSSALFLNHPIHHSTVPALLLALSLIHFLSCSGRLHDLSVYSLLRMRIIDSINTKTSLVIVT